MLVCHDQVRVGAGYVRHCRDLGRAGGDPMSENLHLRGLNRLYTHFH
jgi:hypothetical protein